MGGIVITNDGNCILREVDVSHPTAKSMIELSRAQDEEVGDGTTSVIILAGEMLMKAEPLIKDNIHPTVIVQGYNKALQEALTICDRYEFFISCFIHFYSRSSQQHYTNFLSSP
jgi:T-complex protein 1 subunit gamma